MPLFRDEIPLLSPNAAIDEGLGIETNVGSKIVGSWNEMLFTQYQAAIPTAGSVIGFLASVPCEVTSGQVLWSAASASGTIQITHDTGTQAPGAGSALLASVIPTSTTANTVFNFPKSQAFTAVNSTLQLAKGDRLSVTFAGTFTSQANLIIAVSLKRI